MKYNRKISIISILMIIACILLTACKDSPEPSGTKAVDKANEVSLLGQKNKPENEEEPSNHSWSDKDGLVKLWKEGEEYYIYYDLDKWEEIYDISNYNKKEFPGTTLVDRNLLIQGLNEDIEDVAIVTLEGYHPASYSGDSDFPIIFILMESGEITWMKGYPPKDGPMFEGDDQVFIEEEQYIYGYLPYLEDIESFSYESDGEGIGTLTLFAIDEDGLRYDIRHILDFEFLVLYAWSTYPAYDYGGEFESITLTMWSEGSVSIYKQKNEREIGLYYEGFYDIHLDDSSSGGYRAPSISFDMYLTYTDPENYQAAPEFKGSFMLDEHLDEITFYPLDGDSFEEGIDYFKFFPAGFREEDGYKDDYTNIFHLYDEEFIDYFLSVMPEVKDLVENHGMAVFTDEDFTELIDYGYCRNIYLGTNHTDNFVKETYYTITSDGLVFEYYPLEDLWYLVYNPE